MLQLKGLLVLFTMHPTEKLALGRNMGKPGQTSKDRQRGSFSSSSSSSKDFTEDGNTVKQLCNEQLIVVKLTKFLKSTSCTPTLKEHLYTHEITTGCGSRRDNKRGSRQEGIDTRPDIMYKERGLPYIIGLGNEEMIDSNPSLL